MTAPDPCPSCGADLTEGACAFCPPIDLDDERDGEFDILDNHFEPGEG